MRSSLWGSKNTLVNTPKRHGFCQLRIPALCSVVFLFNVGLTALFLCFHFDVCCCRCTCERSCFYCVRVNLQILYCRLYWDQCVSFYDSYSGPKARQLKLGDQYCLFTVLSNSVLGQRSWCYVRRNTFKIWDLWGRKTCAEIWELFRAKHVKNLGVIWGKTGVKYLGVVWGKMHVKNWGFIRGQKSNF